MAQATGCDTDFEVTPEMIDRYHVWVESVVAATGMPAAELLVEHEPWMHPLDAIAAMAAHVDATLAPDERPEYRDALRTAVGLGDERLNWVAAALGVTREVVKRYDLERIEYDLAGPSATYRYYDEDDRLLYVGITKNPDKRDREHGATEWYPHASRREVGWYVDRVSALADERAAIRDELPVFNRHGSRVDPDEAEEYLMWRDLHKIAAAVEG